SGVSDLALRYPLLLDLVQRDKASWQCPEEWEERRFCKYRLQYQRPRKPTPEGVASTPIGALRRAGSGDTSNDQEPPRAVPEQSTQDSLIGGHSVGLSHFATVKAGTKARGAEEAA
ncbi:hypothetical protein MC885_016038, partial [Smutsia gigantea]